MVKSLVDRDVQVVIDPTLLIDVNEWKKIERKPRISISKKYILLYFYHIEGIYAYNS